MSFFKKTLFVSLALTAGLVLGFRQASAQMTAHVLPFDRPCAPDALSELAFSPQGKIALPPQKTGGDATGYRVTQGHLDIRSKVKGDIKEVPVNFAAITTYSSAGSTAPLSFSTIILFSTPQKQTLVATVSPTNVALATLGDNPILQAPAWAFLAPDPTDPNARRNVGAFVRDLAQQIVIEAIRIVPATPQGAISVLPLFAPKQPSLDVLSGLLKRDGVVAEGTFVMGDEKAMTLRLTYRNNGRLTVAGASDTLAIAPQDLTRQAEGYALPAGLPVSANGTSRLATEAEKTDIGHAIRRLLNAMKKAPAPETLLAQAANQQHPTSAAPLSPPMPPTSAAPTSAAPSAKAPAAPNAKGVLPSQLETPKPTSQPTVPQPTAAASPTTPTSSEKTPPKDIPHIGVELFGVSHERVKEGGVLRPLTPQEREAGKKGLFSNNL
jgi:hypothetical protein